MSGSPEALSVRGSELAAAGYVHYGCGLCAPVGWRNFDASPTLRLQRIPGVGRLVGGPQFPRNIEFGDVTGCLPVASDSCGAVYCSHVLEHLSLDDLRAALAETHRILRKGGVFRLVVPDLEHAISVYLGDGSADAALRFMKGTMLGTETRSRGAMGLLREWLGNSRHLWMWDYKSLERELMDAHFLAIRRAQFGDAADPAFRAVEEESRWEGGLGIEARK